MHMASIFQAMQMTAKIISALDLLRTTLHHNILLDLSAAFDSLEHSLNLNRLKY